MTQIIKYQKHPVMSGIPGFIVNVHDTVNYDIDLLLDTNTRNLYKDVINSTYRYMICDDNLNPLQEVTSCAYRCRLKGVGIKQSLQDGQTHVRDDVKVNKRGVHRNRMMDIIRLIEMNNGWVICNISDVDIYRRLLVDIDIITYSDMEMRDKVIVSAKDILLNHGPSLSLAGLETKPVGNSNYYLYN